jgi:hypothetical protein
MYSAAKHGFGNMVLMLPQRGKEAPPDKYAEVWQEVNGPGTRPPAPMVSGNFYLDESAEYADVQGRKYLANTMRAAVKNYSLDKPGTFTTIKGYEQYENMTMEPEAVEEYSEAFGHGAVTGTPQMILERMWELKQIYGRRGSSRTSTTAACRRTRRSRTCTCSPRRCCPRSRAGTPKSRSTTGSSRRPSRPYSSSSISQYSQSRQVAWR